MLLLIHAFPGSHPWSAGTLIVQSITTGDKKKTIHFIDIRRHQERKYIMTSTEHPQWPNFYELYLSPKVSSLSKAPLVWEQVLRHTNL